jgi:hypothetical protein
MRPVSSARIDYQESTVLNDDVSRVEQLPCLENSLFLVGEYPYWIRRELFLQSKEKESGRSLRLNLSLNHPFCSMRKPCFALKMIAMISIWYGRRVTFLFPILFILLVLDHLSPPSLDLSQ